jgi:hypothetical protein
MDLDRCRAGLRQIIETAQESCGLARDLRKEKGKNPELWTQFQECAGVLCTLCSRIYGHEKRQFEHDYPRLSRTINGLENEARSVFKAEFKKQPQEWTWAERWERAVGHLESEVEAHYSARPKLRRRGGRPPGSNPESDRRIAEAWHTGRYPKYEDLERERDMSKGEVKRALDRHRSRSEKPSSGETSQDA